MSDAAFWALISVTEAPIIVVLAVYLRDLRRQVNAAKQQVFLAKAQLQQARKNDARDPTSGRYVKA